MTQVKPLDITIRYKSENQKPNDDELRHILEHLPELLKEMIQQHEQRRQE